jgi:hypothetical protein
MKPAPTPLRNKALIAYQHVLIEKREEYRRYQQLPLRVALRQKLERLFGTEHVIEVEEEIGKPVLGAVIEEFHFLGFRSEESDIIVVWIEPCPRCGHQMASSPLTSLIDLGQEIVLLSMTGRMRDHECPTPAGSAEE